MQQTISVKEVQNKLLQNNIYVSIKELNRLNKEGGRIIMRKEYTIESELADALFRLSFGKFTYEEAEEIARETAPQFDVVKFPMLEHKGINWYAKQLLKNK